MGTELPMREARSKLLTELPVCPRVARRGMKILCGVSFLVLRRWLGAYLLMFPIR